MSSQNTYELDTPELLSPAIVCTGFDCDYSAYPGPEAQALFFQHYMAADRELRSRAAVAAAGGAAAGTGGQGSQGSAAVAEGAGQGADGLAGASAGAGQQQGEGEALSEQELERLMAEANLFALASHQYWGVWALIQARWVRWLACMHGSSMHVKQTEATSFEATSFTTSELLADTRSIQTEATVMEAAAPTLGRTPPAGTPPLTLTTWNTARCGGANTTGASPSLWRQPSGCSTSNRISSSPK